MIIIELKENKNREVTKDKQKILRAIINLPKPTPTNILDFIDKEAETETENYFSNNDISYSPVDYQKKKEKLSIKRRTLFYLLKSLTRENLISKSNEGIYSVNVIISDNKFIYFPDEFGQKMIIPIGNFFPVNIEKSLSEFVNRFGLYTIFTFLKLIDFIYKNEKENYAYKDLDLDNWLQNAIPLKLMFYSFANLYFKDNNKSNIKILKGLNKILGKQNPSLYKELNNLINENKKDKEMIKQLKEKNKLAMEEYTKEIERMQMSKSYRPKKIKFYPNQLRVYERVVPRNWNDQLEKLVEENEDSN